MAARVGVLALQGDFREHLATLDALGAEGIEVRTPDQLEAVDALVIPGGESTTIGKLAVRFGLMEPLRRRIEEGMPVYGTCAGMILLAREVTDGEQPLVGALDVVVERNAFGRQNESFEEELAIDGLEEPLWAVFIRAPWVAKVGEGVEVLASVDDHPVVVRQGHILASSFHPELTGDHRLHQMLLDWLVDRSA
ncbi:MAG TPA: pyridoxal 5'-phosphate synthase glutaminase subunit PdxT [Acidimicrobiia bacterium]|nr:pyridoxal 5'-phosphate synthase glutaminase subunit PdxT [Acidimicrobiia bacterium]